MRLPPLPLYLLCSVAHLSGGSIQMDLATLAQSASHALGSLQLDDSTVSVLAMVLGICGGWMLTGLHQQLKAKRVKVSRRQPHTRRKPD